MQLFTAKYLLQQAAKGKAQDEYVEYLNDMRNPGFKKVQDLYPAPDGPHSFTDPKYLIKLYRYRALKGVIDMAEAYQHALAKGFDATAAFNQVAIQAHTAAKAQGHFLNVTAFY